MQIDTGYRPLPKQDAFHRCAGNEVLFGGAAGGAKSHALRHEALDWCLRIPGLQAYLFRRTFPELDKNHIITSLQEYPKELGTYNHGKRRWDFHNGSMLHFCHCQYEQDVFQYQGAEITLLLIDELTTFTEFQYDYLRSRVRTTLDIPDKYRNKLPGIVCASNPGGVGHQFVKDRWVRFCAPGELRRSPDREGGMMRCFIPSKLQDNPILMIKDPGYINRLDALPEPYRTAYKDGNWDIFIGQAFDFNDDYHVVDNIPIPDHAPIYTTYDYGFGAPFSWAWWWVDNDGRVYRFAEWYGWTGEENKGLRYEDSRVAEEILKRELELSGQYHIDFKKVSRLGSPDCWNKKPDWKGGGQGPSTSEEFSKKGIYMAKADANREQKIRQFRERLRVPRDGNGKQIGLPMMLVYRGCMDFIRTVKELQVDPKNVEYIIDTGETHPFDDACQIAMARPIALVQPKKLKTMAQSRIDSVEKPDIDDYEQLLVRESAITMDWLDNPDRSEEGWHYNDVNR